MVVLTYRLCAIDDPAQLDQGWMVGMTMVFESSSQLLMLVITVMLMVLGQGVVQDLSNGVLLQVDDFSASWSECSSCGIIRDLGEWKLEAWSCECAA